MTGSIYWTLADSSQAPLENPERFLTPSELQELSALRFAKRRSEWLLGRWTAKSLIKSIPAYQHYSLDEIEIHNSPDGAPYFQPLGGAALPDCLSISHCDRFALCALSLEPDTRIGIDMEKIEPRPRMFVEDYFTEAECELVNAHPVETRDKMVTLIWSAKESMLKALGVGLRWDTRQVEVREINSEGNGWEAMQVANLQQENRNWSAWWQPRDQFVITLAGFNKMGMSLQSATGMQLKV